MKITSPYRLSTMVCGMAEEPFTIPQIRSSSVSMAKGITQPLSATYASTSSRTMEVCTASIAMSPSCSLYSASKCGSSFTQGAQLVDHRLMMVTLPRLSARWNSDPSRQVIVKSSSCIPTSAPTGAELSKLSSSGADASSVGSDVSFTGSEGSSTGALAVSDGFSSTAAEAAGAGLAGLLAGFREGSSTLNQSRAKHRTASAMPQAIRPARFRFCGASFGSPGTPPSGAFNIAFPAFREIAFCGQTSIQRAQLMHSWSPTCLTSMPQLRTQEPQPLHRLVSTLTPARQKRLNSP